MFALKATTSSSSTDDRGWWASFRPYFGSRKLDMAGMAVASMLAGAVEAVLLVMIANIALIVGGSDQSQGLAANLGPIDALNLSVGQSLVFALGLGLLRSVLQVADAAIAGRMIAELIRDIRASVFQDYIRTSWAEQSSHSEADIQDLLVRHVNRATGAVSAIARGISTSCLVLALLASAVVVDPLSAGLLVVAGGLLFVVIRPLTRLAKGIARRQVVAGQHYAEVSLEAISTSQEIRAFGVNDRVADRLRKATDAEVEPTRHSFVLREIVTSSYQLATILLLLSGLFAVYKFVDRPLASLGAIVVILVRALNQTGQIQSYYHLLTETGPFLDRLADETEKFRANVPSSGNTRIAAPERLVLEHVTYEYLPGRPAVEDVSIEVSRGETVGLIGPSGSGKSTIIQIILRLRQPDSGRYLLDGVDAADVDDESWFDQIAFVPQDSRLIAGTVADNIAFFRPDVTRAQIEDAAKRAYVHEEILALPDGYETDLGSRGGSLSGGQRQRVTIARALVRDPSILVLDEPTSALDMRSESLVHQTFAELKGRVTIFVIAHRLSTLNTCDRLLVMGDGRVQAYGSRTELERDSAFYREALRLSKIRGGDEGERS
ncbi:MAG: ABC transporter ATP-binding protein [Acidimicrobiales bacterium]|nr:ABC transporter ATP-binding protein [Acidimicrobiales bacterium]